MLLLSGVECGFLRASIMEGYTHHRRIQSASRTANLLRFLDFFGMIVNLEIVFYI